MTSERVVIDRRVRLTTAVLLAALVGVAMLGVGFVAGRRNASSAIASAPVHTPGRVKVAVPVSVDPAGAGWADRYRLFAEPGWQPPTRTDPTPLYATETSTKVIALLYPNLTPVAPGTTYAEAIKTQQPRSDTTAVAVEPSLP